MLHKIIFEDGGEISLLPGLPADWKGKVLPYSKPFSGCTKAGTILLQQVETSQYILSYFFLHFLQKISLQIKKSMRLQSFLLIKGLSEHKFSSVMSFTLQRHEFILSVGEGEASETIIFNGNECEFWNIQYNPGSYKDLLSLFPQIPHELKKNRNKAYLISPSPKEVHMTVLDAIRNQFYIQFPKVLSEHYFRLKVEEILFVLLAQTFSDNTETKLSKREKLAAETAQSIILTNIRNHYTIAELAKKVGTNEADLKRVFRQQYGVGMFHFLQRARFEKAAELIMQGELNIKQIASIVGYHHTTTFITEFRKYFGYTPLDLKKGIARAGRNGS